MLLIGLIIAGLGLVGLLVFYAWNDFGSLEQQSRMRSLMGQRYADDQGGGVANSDSLSSLPSRSVEDLEVTVRSPARKAPTLEERLFRAGLFTQQQKDDFKRMRVLFPSVLFVLFGGYGMSSGDFSDVILYGSIGVLAGVYLPLNRLDKWTRDREEEIAFYLPLVIEQISIGVSSSLDIGPCIARVVQMAEERDSHNPVTELLRYAQAYVKSGVSFQDALSEVGRLSGNNDVKHSFRALAQVARFGGEISKQLQDLSESVASQRESRVEAKIKKLELSATGPVAMVFAGFLVILICGFGMAMSAASR
jgi:Flp pilus assembly protein TadB